MRRRLGGDSAAAVGACTIRGLGLGLGCARGKAGEDAAKVKREASSATCCGRTLIGCVYCSVPMIHGYDKHTQTAVLTSVVTALPVTSLSGVLSVMTIIMPSSSPWPS